MFKFATALASFALAANAWHQDKYSSDSHGLGFDSIDHTYGSEDYGHGRSAGPHNPEAPHRPQYNESYGVPKGPQGPGIAHNPNSPHRP